MDILIDFDGTCTTHEFPAIGKDIGAVPVLKRLIENGHRLILFTMRSDMKGARNYLSDAVDWFDKRGIPLFGIQTNPFQSTWTDSPKAFGQLIIDDTAIGCPLIFPEGDAAPYADWIEIEKLLEEMGVLRRPSARVISAFPGTGKSYFTENTEGVILDSDSSEFSWLAPGVRHPDFPDNYMRHIKKNLGKADIIMVSSHQVVRDALVKHGIEFDLYYPDRSLKDEYLERFRKRGNDTKFLSFLSENWDKFIDEMEQQVGVTNKVSMSSGTFLSDYVRI